MKSCAKNRKLIAWLAVDALDAAQAAEIRAHLETCEECRRYLQEVSNVRQKLATTEVRSDIQASEAFHQRVLGAFKDQETGSAWQAVAAQLRASMMNWRVALPVIAAAVVMIAAFSLVMRRPAVTPGPPVTGQIATAPKGKSDLDPTISNYQMVANRSLDNLDDLLTRQANRNPSPTPIYTASALARVNALE
jgi:hypothetical protein